MIRPITPVASSAMKNSRKSSMSRSASLPTGTNFESPTPNCRSRGAMLLKSAPLWAAMETGPAWSGSPWEVL
jgi:hypothetical protein